MTNTRMLAGLASALLLACALCACRTRLLVTDITHDDCTTVVDGIPFRVRETHTLRVYQWHAPKVRTTVVEGVATTEVLEAGCFKEVMRKEVAFPNQRRLFALNFRSEQFADHVLNLTYFPDNTLRSYSLTGTPRAEGLNALMGATTGAAAAMLEAEEKVRARAAKLLEDEAGAREKRKGRLEDLFAYVEKRDALRQTCADWEEWEEDARAVNLERVEYERRREEFTTDARKGLREAMLAAVTIGRSLYEGDPSSLSIDQICGLINREGGA